MREALPKIFDAFEQGGRTKFGGLGLGLAISKALAEAHKGTITAESAGRNQGAQFSIILPTTAKVGMQSVTAAVPRSQPRQSRRILLVEDHDDTNRSLTKLLRLRGYEVESAKNIESALYLSTTAQFDVLVSDIGLPDGTGIDLIRRLRSDRPALAIALTGFGMEDDLRKTQDAGFNHHLVKPIDVNKLDLLIQESSSAAA